MPVAYGLMIFGIMLGLRYLYFVVTRLKISPTPLVFITPRGLISILLFLQIAEVSFIKTDETQIDERVLLVVILISMLIMTRGTMKKPTLEIEEIEKLEDRTALDVLLEEQNTDPLPPVEPEKE